MSLNPLLIQEGAILVADAHFATYRTDLNILLNAIESGKLITPQLILLGDIFDLLFGPVDAFVAFEREAIEQINRIATLCEVIYLEGNHDFLLQELFPSVRIISRAQQPVAALYNGQSGWLAHGDWDTPLGYNLYTALIRNKTVVYVLNKLNNLLGHPISNKLRSLMQRKNLCRDYAGFQARLRQRFAKDSSYHGWFIEGHFHQGIRLNLGNITYFNIEAMACKKSYFVVQSKEHDIQPVKQLLEELI